MRSDSGYSGALAGAFFSLFAITAGAAPQVVGDQACERYAVDIAAFATCVDGKVVRPEDARLPGPARPAVAPAARATGAGTSVAAAERTAAARSAEALPPTPIAAGVPQSR